MMQQFSYTEKELESGGSKVVFSIPVRHGFKKDMKLDWDTLQKPDVLRAIIRLHLTECAPATGPVPQPLITVMPTPRGALVQVEGLVALFDLLTGGNALDVECSSPQHTQIVMPSLPRAFYKLVPDCIVYELLLPVGDKHSIQSFPMTGFNTDVSIEHIGALVSRSHCATAFLPVVQALLSMVTLRELARTTVPERLEYDETLLPSGAVAEVADTKEVKTSLPYLDFATSYGNWQTHMLMLKNSVRVGVGKKDTKNRRLILDYTTIDCLAYVIPEVPNHVVPHLQISKFSKAASNWKIYPTCYRAGIVAGTERINLAEYEI